MVFRGRITIKSTRDDVDVQGVGCRVFIALRILMFSERDLKAFAVNDRSDEKTVHVYVEGRKKTVERLLQILKEDLIKKFGNPAIEISLGEDPAVHVPPRTDFTQGLILEQLGKGIDAQFVVLKKLGKGDEKWDIMLKKLEKGDAALDREFQQLEKMVSSQKEIVESQKEIVRSQKKTTKAIEDLPPKINKSLDALPGKIAEALKGPSKSGAA